MTIYNDREEEIEAVLLDGLQRIVTAQERIATADERRNELLEADTARREELWAYDQKQRDRVAAQLEPAMRLAEDSMVVEWIRESLHMSQDWADTALALVATQRKIQKIEAEP